MTENGREYEQQIKEMRRWKDVEDRRPPFAYVALIVMAIMSNKQKRETLNGIYKFVLAIRFYESFKSFNQ